MRMSRELRVILAVLAIGLGVGTVVLRAYEYRDPRRSIKDFAIDYAAARAWRAGDDPFPADSNAMVNQYLHASGPVEEKYEGAPPYWHPPFRLFTVLPLSWLPYEVAGVLWLLFSSVTIVVAALIFGTELGYSPRWSAVIGVAALAHPAVQSDLSWGQVNGPLLLLLVLAWRWLRRDADAAAGIGIGVASALKVFPAFLGLHLLAARRDRALCASILSGGIATLASMAIFGFGRLGRLLRLAGAYKTYGATRFNISAGGQLQYFLGARLGIAVTIVVAVPVVAVVFWRKALLTKDPFWTAVIAMLLVWPITWDHYMTLALPWFAIALLRADRWNRIGVLIAMLLCAAGVQSVGGHPGGFLATLGLGCAFILECRPLGRRKTEAVVLLAG